MPVSAYASTIHARLAHALAPPKRAYRILRVEGQAAGYLTASRASRLMDFAGVFERNGEELRFVNSLADTRARTAAIAEVAATLAAEGALSAWRDERYGVRSAFSAAPWFLLERAAARYFGVHTWAAHVNGLVRSQGGTRIWFARRSPGKAIDPGLLDNLVGGGIRAGASIRATVIAESWEEAGIVAKLATTARRKGTLSLCREQPDGLQRETIYAHDLDLPTGFGPESKDGEAFDHRCVDLTEAARLISLDTGPDVATTDASLVVLDCLLRRGAFAPGDPLLPALWRLGRGQSLNSPGLAYGPA